MENINIKNKYITRDRIYRIIDKQGFFRAALLKNTNTVQDARQKHNLSLLPAFFLGKVLSAASLLASFLKGEERIIVEIDSEGLITKIFAEAIQLGEVRGFIKYDSSINDVKFHKLEKVIGKGQFKVSRILYNRVEPVTGVVPIYKGDVGSDLANYFAQSEQIPSAVILEVNFDDSGNIISSGGLLVQALPEAPPQLIHELYIKLSELKKEGLFKNDENIDDVLNRKMPFYFNIIKTSQVDFFCRCSKTQFLEKMITLDLNEIESMEKQGHNELVCQYCNSKYIIEKEDFDWLKNIILSQSN